MGHMLITEDQFKEIKARWRAAFAPPFYAEAELWDGNMRVAFYVHRGNVTLVKEVMLADPLTNPQELDRFADAVKARIGYDLPTLS